MRPSASSSASEMGSYAACSFDVGLLTGSALGVSLCNASSNPARANRQSGALKISLYRLRFRVVPNPKS